MLNIEKYKEEKEEPEVDWSKVKVNTPILVSEDAKKWYRRYFAKFINGGVYYWADGTTSWTADDEEDVFYTKYAKLAESEEQEDE